MKHVVVDPITRIEGHLRVEVQVDEGSGKVTDALSSGTAWRGLELVMKDRDPRDAWAYIQRICGVCTSAHALGSLRAVEDALGIKIPKNANYIRNIMAATLTVQDHIVHFYHLHALDWVSPVEALAADPVATANLQVAALNAYKLPFSAPGTSVTEAYDHAFPAATPQYFAEIKNKVQAIVESGQLGIFSAISLEDGNSPVNTARLGIVDRAINLGRTLVNNFYIPDVLAIGAAYVKAGRVDGGGLAKERVLGYGSYPIEPFSGTANGDFFKNLLIRTNGVVEDFGKGIDAAKVYEIDAEDLTQPEVFTEGVEHSWYEYPADGEHDRNPWDGVTAPKFTAPKEGTPTDWKALNEQGKYSWLKTPKWRGKLCEVGPLARYIIIYTKAKKGMLGEPTWAEKMMLDQIDAVSKVLGLAPEAWLPTMIGRTAARGLDCQLNAEINKFFFDKLIANIKSGDTKTANMEKWDPSTWPKTAKGVGLYEAPRGALSHYIVIKDGKTDNYQAVVPTTWNACPRDDEAGHGAYEKAMMDTQVKIADKPLEIVKVVRSFDPCMACATHMFNAKGEKINVITTDPYSGTRVEK